MSRILSHAVQRARGLLALRAGLLGFLCCSSLFFAYQAHAQATLSDAHQTMGEAQAVPASASQTQTRERVLQTQGGGRVMAGHEFPFGQFVPTSFVVTTFGVHAGFESRQVPKFPTDTTTGSESARKIDLNSVIATEGFDGAVRVNRFLAVTLDFYGKVRVGINTPTLLGTGADFEIGGNAGLLLRLLRTERLQVSLRGSGGYYWGEQAGIARFYQNVRAIAQQTASRVLSDDNVTVDAERARIDKSLSKAANALLTSASGFRLAGYLTAAYTINPYLGAQGVLGFNYERSSYASNEFQITGDGTMQLRETVKLHQTTLGTALDLNGLPRNIPVDVVFEYVFLPLRSRRAADIGPGSQITREHRLALGVYYAGRADMQLGFSAYALYAQTRELGAEGEASDKPRDLGGLFSFRYIW